MSDAMYMLLQFTGHNSMDRCSLLSNYIVHEEDPMCVYVASSLLRLHRLDRSHMAALTSTEPAQET